MRLLVTVAALTAMATSFGWSQGFEQVGVSIGIKGGFPLTQSVEDTRTSASSSGFGGFLSTTDTHFFSDAKNYLVGPTVELYLPLHLSVEADGLYRRINFGESVASTVTPPRTVGLPPTTTALNFHFNNDAWEVSLLGKYRFSTPVLKPYISAGPSFRAISNADFANKGVTAAAGAELKLWKLQAGPELRYTHWGNDPFLRSNTVVIRTGDFSTSVTGTPIASPVHTGRNQLELLFGVAF
jgi:hypothetical protein